MFHLRSESERVSMEESLSFLKIFIYLRIYLLILAVLGLS